MANKLNCISKGFSQDIKYPARHTYLPSNFGSRPSDNSKVLIAGPNIYDETFSKLTPSSVALGVNKKSVKTNTIIAFGEIYIVWAVGTSLHKIGVSTDFNRRFRDLSSYSPLPLEVVKYGRCDNPHLLESHLHKKFAHLLFKNEWFSLSDDELSEIDEVFDRYFEKRGHKNGGTEGE